MVVFAASENGGVISGMRGNCEVLVRLNVSATLTAGIKLYRSENGVLLSPGDGSGCIPPCLFEIVVDLRTGESLLPKAKAPRGGGAVERGSAAHTLALGLLKQVLAAPPASQPAAGVERQDRPIPAQLAEVVGDLFAPGYGVGDGICHCVSEDMHMGAGIATQCVLHTENEGFIVKLTNLY